MDDLSNNIRIISVGKETFMIKYMYHQNHTNHGTIYRLSTKTTLGFRSDLELIRILESVVDVNDWYPQMQIG